MSTRTGPFEELEWPERLNAIVVDPTPRPRVHGYDLEQDLAHHYTLAETMLLALTGEAPTQAQGHAFEVALVFACACPINEAPTHTAVVARSIGAPVSAALASGFLVACEAARATLTEHAELLRWLEAPGPELPACARAGDPRDSEAVAELRALLDRPEAPATLSPEMSRTAALLAVMWGCGLRSEDQLVVALAWAKTLSVGAEAVAAKRGGMVNMPARLPSFRYEAPTR